MPATRSDDAQKTQHVAALLFIFVVAATLYALVAPSFGEPEATTPAHATPVPFLTER